VCHDGRLYGAQKFLLLVSRHLDIGEIDTKVTSGQPRSGAHLTLPVAVKSIDTLKVTADRASEQAAMVSLSQTL
jgi:hypothetical protein